VFAGFAAELAEITDPIVNDPKKDAQLSVLASIS
jgi:hypothetical protein